MATGTDDQQLIFISYAHENGGWIEALGLDREPEGVENARFWLDRSRLLASDRWDEKATEALREASAVILLVSTEFLASSAIRDHELPLIAQRFHESAINVVFVPIGTVDINEIGRLMGITQIDNLLSIPPWTQPLPHVPESSVATGRKIVSAATEPAEVQILRRTIQSKYQLMYSLGSGPLGRVFTAHDSQLHRQVAIKLLHRDEGDRLFKDSVRRVVRATEHTNILSIYGAYLDTSPPYYVRQYADGDSLRTILDKRFKGGELPLQLVQELLPTIGAAVSHAHDKRVNALNIRPSNVIVTNPGDSTLREYILSLNSYDELDFLQDNKWRKKDKSVLYLPPELRGPQTALEQPDPRKADQYRTGLVAYEMLIGATKFEELAAPLRRRRFEPSTWHWPPVCSVRKNCLEYIGAAVDRMISTDPQSRYDSVRAAILDIEKSDIDVELVRDSYRRLLKSPDEQTEFFHSFYTRFLGDYQHARKFFKKKKFGPLNKGDGLNKAWQRQFQALKEAVLLLAVFKAFHEDGREPNILTRIAEEHARRGIPQGLYSAFAEVLIDTVIELDQDAGVGEAQLRRSWHNVIQPGIDYMKSKTDEFEQDRMRGKHKGKSKGG